MSNIRVLLRLNNRLHARGGKAEGRDIFGTLFGAVVGGLIAALVLLLLSALIVNFEKAGAEFELLVFTLFIVLLLQVIWSTALCVRVFFSASQNELLMKYPISSRSLFFSKLLFVFLRELIFGLCMLLPILNMYGIMLGFTWAFFAVTPVVALLCTLLGFLAGALLSFPFVFVKMFLSNKFLITLILFASVAVVIFIGYMRVINNVVDITNSINFNINSKVIDAIVAVSALVYPTVLLSNILFYESFASSLLIFLGFTALALGILVLLEEFFYKKMLEANIGGERTYRSFKKSNRKKGTLSALMTREFVIVFRNSGYLFQYFAFIIISPLMAYLCVESSAGISFANIGNIAQAAIAFFVVCVFSIITNSFAATSISREGEAFYLIKIYPLKYRVFVLSKVLFNSVFIAISILASFIALASFGLIGWGSAVVLAPATAFFSIFQICISIWIDLKKPQFVDDQDVAKNDRNTSVAITLGLVFSMVLGLTAIAVAVLAGNLAMCLVMLISTLALAALGVLILFGRLDKNYERI